MKRILTATLALAALAAPAHAQAINEAATSWVLISTGLVLLMTLPGLALFYGGMVTSRNVLNTLMQCFVTACVITLSWTLVGYSLSFGSDEGGLLPGFFGSLDKSMLNGILPQSVNPLAPHIPELVYFMFQMTFAIITPALMIGSIVERIRFSALITFMLAWSVLVYAPIAHMVWGGGILAHDGILDFAGGTVVHVNAGVGALVISLILGPRFGWHPKASDFAPHNLVFSIMGAALLWVGWFGFNGGSALAANGVASLAIVNTQLAAAAATLVWLAVELALHRRASAVGMITGAVAGLVAITPAAGFVEPGAALLIGAIAGVVCYLSSWALKHYLCFDDSLDVVGVHGIGGVVGALLTGVFASTAVGATPGLLEGNAMQMWVQTKGLLYTIAWCGVGTYVIVFLIDKTMGLRMDVDVEKEGHDQHR